MKIAPFELERYFAAHEFNVRHSLCSSDCQSISVAELLAMEPGAEDRFRDLWLGYTESQGNPGLRAEIAKLYQQISPDEVLVFAGAEEAIFVFMNATFGPGDHVVIH